MRVPVETTPDFSAGVAEILLEPGPYPVLPLERPFDISPDGQRFLMIKAGDNSDDSPVVGLTQIIVVQNWFEELKRLVPVE